MCACMYISVLIYVCKCMCVHVCVLWHIKAWGTRYVHVAEVNGIIEKYTGVWPMADSELCLETSG